MKPLDLSLVLEATRLTRAGFLTEATALLRQALGRSQGPAALSGKSRKVPLSVPLEDDIDDKARPAPGSAPALKPRVRNSVGQLLQSRVPRAPDWQAKLPGSAGRALQPADIAPGVGRYLSGTFANGDGTRSYKLYVPALRDDRPAPLIVMLHGCNQSADDFAAGTRMNFAAEQRGCFVVYPEQPQAANASKCWNWFRADDQKRGHGEPALIAGITRQMMKDYSIDPRRVYVAGLSAGGAAAATMGEAYPDLFAAVGVHSGLACHSAHDIQSAFGAMRGQSQIAGASRAGMRTVPTIVFHGDQDSTVHPCNGAKVITRANGDARLQAAAERKTAKSGHHYSHTVQLDAEGRSILELWELHGAGHAWSGGSPAGSFTSPDGPDATQEMLRFFLEHRRSAD